ncbi:hypothetical protein BHAOGJBA_0760 [Methylobacterium hispanicum]|uniref:Uncharacterized protein n=1 Tax=Methylobacterium hispanicum TaxID=270350 RepID=A0AAV4ZFK4_9HYPH|nr:hypothetical protein [Methylobacterium hispanicum]GJD87260.1 hypothetical protein BHAOGJBA_0760 [Methylobacterium hispanicum]
MSRLTVDELAGAAATAFGFRWAAPLADALSREAGRTVAATQIHQWTSGARPVPAWVADTIVLVLKRRAHELQRQARATYAEAQHLERVLVPPLPDFEPDPDAEPEADNDLTPRMG